MRSKRLSLRKGFRVHRGNRRAQAAEMVIPPYAKGGEPLPRGRR